MRLPDIKAFTLGFVATLAILFLPLSVARAAPLTLSCCLCNVSKGEASANFCLNVTPMTSCENAGPELVKIYNEKNFIADCQPLEKSNCQVISEGNTSAKCPFAPVTHSSAAKSDINKAYLDTVMRNIKARESLSTGNASENFIPAAVRMQLNIPIPGVEFPSDLYTENGVLYVPYLAIYLSSFQKYLIGLGLVVAAIMLVYGGFLYIISATGAKVQDAKALIQDALIGLGLILGCYVILANVNPNTGIMSTLKVPFVRPDYWVPATGPLREAVGNAQKADIAALIEGVKLAKGDPCAVLTFCEHETGLRQLWNGWPSNPKENSFSWGACSADAKYTRDGSQADKAFREAFPDIWPPLGTDLPIPSGKSANYSYSPIKGELLITNSKLNGFYAASYAKNSIKSIADAGIGGAHIDRWRIANKCPEKVKDITLSDAAVMGVDAAIAASCLPNAAAGGDPKSPRSCASDNFNCGPFDPEKVGEKPNFGYKVMPNGEVHGKCASTGAECYTIMTIAHVRYSIDAYKRFDSKYKCSTAKK